VYVNCCKLRIHTQFAPLGGTVLVYDPAMTEDQVRVHGNTGVDLTLRVAGPGNRSYAFLIDWHVRALLALAWLLLAATLFKRSLNLQTLGALWSALPALGIYFLYHPALEIVLRGRTPGKRMAGLRIVTRRGGTPGAGALLVRNLFRVVDSLPAFYVVGLVCCFASANRVRIGDIAAGTLLVMDDRGAAKPLERVGATAGDSPLSLDGLELVNQLLERWESLAPSKRKAIAESLLERLASPDAAGETAAAAMDDAQLRLRLQELLRGGAPAA
jgi:uncharacterized RDD family membrane protein YckC